MRYQKIRGHRRIWRDIAAWRERNLRLDLEQLAVSQREYVKMWVHPYSGISLLGSEVPEPRGETRRRMLEGLLDIHDAWKEQLDGLGQPYYLRIWLFDPWFSRSQVVCALGDFLNFYDQTFFRPPAARSLNPENFGPLSNRMAALDWAYHLDEEHLDNGDYLDAEAHNTGADHQAYQQWLDKKRRKPHRTIPFKSPIGHATEGYAFRTGTVWIGKAAASF